MAAEAALNKSLDDLIAEQRTKKDVHKEVRITWHVPPLCTATAC